jgi:hypothetical protein
VLTALGLSQRDAERTVETFREHDERLLGLQYAQQKNDACMVALSREWAKELEQIFEQDARDDSRGDG